MSKPDVLAIADDLIATTTGLVQASDRRVLLDIGPLTALAVDRSRIVTATPGRVAVSIDAGATWRWTDLPLADTVATAIHLINETILIGTLQDGALRSTDGGTSFTPTLGLVDHRIVAIARAGDDIITLTESGPVRSTSAGRSWHDLPWPGTDPCIALAATDRWIAIAGTTGTVRHTTDHATWHDIGTWPDLLDLLATPDGHLLVITDLEMTIVPERKGEWRALPLPETPVTATIDGPDLAIATTAGDIVRLAIPRLAPDDIPAR